MPTTNKKSKENKALMIGFALILIVILFAFVGPGFKKNKSDNSRSASQNEMNSYTKISFSELQSKINNNKESVRIIDIRDGSYYSSEHIVDSISIPFNQLEQLNINDNTDKFIVVLGQGLDSDATQESQAVKILKNKGFKNVAALEGGMLSWKSNSGQTISWGDPNSFVDNSKVTFISPEDLKQFINSKSYIYILDVRPSADFSAGHIPGAANIPLDELEKRNSEIPSEKIIVAYGGTDFQSFQAGVRLYDLNFFSARALQGGFTSWKDKQFELEK